MCKNKMQRVYVQNKDGEPLMPCTPAKAKHLLRDKKAELIHLKDVKPMCKPCNSHYRGDVK